MIRVVVSVVLCGWMLVACDSSTAPTTPDNANPRVITRADVRPDSAAGWLYYSIALDSVIPPQDAASGLWDVRLAYLKGGGATRTVDIVFNHGVGGVAPVQGYVAASRFENVTAVPAGAPFRQEDTTAANRIVPNCVTCPDAVFVYDPMKHVILPSPDRAVVVRLRDGGVWAFQVTSIYEGANETPTMFSPIGYYHWRTKKLN